MTPSRCIRPNDSQRTPLGKRSPQEIRSFAWETAVFPVLAASMDPNQGRFQSEQGSARSAGDFMVAAALCLIRCLGWCLAWWWAGVFATHQCVNAPPPHPTDR